MGGIKKRTYVHTYINLAKRASQFRHMTTKEKSRQTIMWRKIDKKYNPQKYKERYDKHNHSEKAKKHRKKYRQSEKGKLALYETLANRKRNLKFIPLFENPFPIEVKVHYHHINNLLVIPLPAKLHNAGNNQNILEHRELCIKTIENIYCLNLNKLFNDNP